MSKTISLIISLALLLLAGCSNQYTGLGFPYSMDSKKEKISNIDIPDDMKTPWPCGYDSFIDLKTQTRIKLNATTAKMIKIIKEARNVRLVRRTKQ